MYDITLAIISSNNPHTPLIPKGIVIHETACNGDTAAGEQHYFDSNNVQASAHAFIDWNSIIQCIQWYNVSWHAGATANNRFIGIELCHTDDQARFNEIWKRGVWLCAYLFVNVLNMRIVTPDNLMSHAEVSDRWHETDHQDPVSYFGNHGKSVDNFRRDVQVMITEITKPQETTPEAEQWKKDGAQWLKDNDYTKELHNPLESIDIGLLGAMLKNKGGK